MDNLSKAQSYSRPLILRRVIVILISVLVLGTCVWLLCALPPADAGPATIAGNQLVATENRFAEPAFLFNTTMTRTAAASHSQPFNLVWSSSESQSTTSIAWGDYDGDGDLDLAVGNTCFWAGCHHPNRIYRNDGVVGGTPQMTMVWEAPYKESSESLTWGDYDNDGDLDLAVGNGCGGGQDQCYPNRVYRNDGEVNGRLEMTLVWSSTEPEIPRTYSVAWGDADGDGDLDLAVGNSCLQHASQICFRDQLYRNDGESNGQLGMTLIWTSPVTYNTFSVAWGDYDGDGHLDLAVGNGCRTADNQCYPNHVYRNVGGPSLLSASPVYSTSEHGNGSIVAWGDYDGDGSLDLAVGNEWAPTHLYHNDNGTLSPGAVYSTTTSDVTASIAWGDYDSDGDLDLVLGNMGQSMRLYRNDGAIAGVPTMTLVWSSEEADPIRSVAWGDFDGDGDLDLAAGNGYHWTGAGQGAPNRLYRNNGSVLTTKASWAQTDSDTASSVAWGDVDDDGDLDLFVGNHGNWFVGRPNTLYRNDGGSLTTYTVYSTTEADMTTCVAWGDVDGDSDLDVAVGNKGQPNRIYRNDNGVLTPRAVWSAPFTETTNSLAWGDYDNDGDLDLAVASVSVARLYRNDGMAGEVPQLTPVWTIHQASNATSVAWGDVDGDGDLDLAVGNGCWYSDPAYCRSVLLYRNDNGAVSSSAVWSSAESDYVQSVAWGDVDGDGDPDLAVGIAGARRLYLNDNGTLSATAVWASVDADLTTSVVWGDVDSDGDLDLAAGTGSIPGVAALSNQPNRLYRNDGDMLTASAAWLSASVEDTFGLAWGDVDGDGDLDLAAAGGTTNGGAAGGTRVRVYANSRDARSLLGSIPVVSVVRPGPNADLYSSPRIWSAAIPITYTLSHPNGNPVKAIRAWYSPNGGGQWLPAVAASGTVTTDLGTTNYVTQTYLNMATMPIPDLSTLRSMLSLTPTDMIADLDVTLNLTHTRDGNLAITLTAPFSRSVALVNRRGGDGDDFIGTVFDDEVTTSIVSGTAPFTGRFRPEQTLSRFDGFSPEGQWTISIADTVASDTGTLLSWGMTVTLNSGVAYTYLWDAAGSGFFGQSDNVAFRIQAVPTVVTGTRNATPGPYLYGAYASQTFPFRVRGTQVRVISGTVPASNALVYRLPAGQPAGSVLMADATSHPFHTDGQGYLQGRGQIGLGDRLLALVPITATESYTLYYTNGAPNPIGLDTFTVTASGVQTLTVSSAHPLVLFNLDVSLEWDAHNDPTYLEQLAFDLRQASQYLYDFTDGQAALGHVTVYQNGENWASSHIVVQATNRLRPLAAQGGSVLTPTIDPGHSNIVYNVGQVRMGAAWNRYGSPGASQGSDWALALAHELSHYLLFQEDTYLGLNDEGLLIPVGTCTGSAMGDMYTPDNTELIYDAAHWQTACARTLANQTLGRTEWQTLRLWYPGLARPVGVNTGPGVMPFELTTVQVRAPLTPTAALEDPTFYLDYANNEVSSSEARTFLLREMLPGVEGYDYVIDVGSPVGGQNRVLARGAQPGDRLCSFDPAHHQYGCEVITLGDDRLQLETDETWAPVLRLSPVTSRTLALQVDGLASGLALRARLYPEYDYAGPVITLARGGSVYSGTFVSEYPALSGHVQIWVEEGATETNPRREAIVGFTVAGNAGNGPFYRSGGPFYRSGGPFYRSGGPFYRSGGAPLVSPDGQMIFFTENPIVFEAGDLYAVQGMSSLPALPPGRTVIGRGYRLAATRGTPVITGSVSIQYRSDEVLTAGADEQDLTIYYHDGSAWRALPTVRNEYFNLVTAPSQGEGVYALMSSVEIQLSAPGWNLFAYPLRATLPVTVALESVSGYYRTVYGYEAGDSLDPWKVYQVGGPVWLNDLQELRFGRGYWISVTQAVTMYLGSGSQMLASAGGMPGWPPDTYYGEVSGDETFVPAAGMNVEARVGDGVCGRGTVRAYGGKLVYVVDVVANDGSVHAGCGETGRAVWFYVDGHPMKPIGIWDNGQLDEMPLLPGRIEHVYLPLIMRQR